MISTSAAEGVKISNINLINPDPRLRVSYGNLEFHVKIKFRGKTQTSTKTEKKSLDGDRVIWTESFSFAGSIANSVVTFQVFKTHLLHRTLVGTLEKGVAELLSLPGDSGLCTFDMGGKSGQLTFSIELQPTVLPDIVGEASKASAGISSVEGPAKIANAINSAHDTCANQEETWSSFLSQFQIFVNVIDKIAEVHPYAKLAWSILSVIPKTIMSLKDRNESVKQLCEKLKETYDFITDAKRLLRLSETQDVLILKLVQQTIECGYFIREYSRGKIVERIWKGAKLDDKIKAFIDQFDHIQKAMNNSTTLEMSIATLRISETIDETKELTLLSEMPYARDAGFVTEKRCLPGTRQGLIQEIMDWVNDDTAQQILVLSGAAGMGKSAIAHTIADIFRKQNRLGSLFCFSRSYKDRRNSLFSTISRDLADTDVSWRKELIKVIGKTAIRKSPDIETQFEELIVKPSRETAVVGPVIIVIDALDESGDRGERQALLDILFGQLSKLPTNYRILLTTRPETDIEPRCQSSTVVCKRMGDIAPNGTLSDIQSYVSFRLKDIALTLDGIQSDWRDVLAKRSEGLFQWAETVCRFINPTVRDPALVEKRWKTFTSGSSTSLYELYHDIISSQEEARDSDFTNDFKKIISAIMTAREPLTVHALKTLFQDIRSVQMKLEPFGSLFLGVHDSSTPVRPLHTSLFDFFHSPVQNEAKHNQYYVDTSDQSVFTLGCLRLLNRTLRFNMSNLETSHVRNRDIPDLDARVGKAIPLELSYSCRFWAFHLRDSHDRRDLVPELRTLMHEKILYLFEALSLLGDVDPGLVAMRIVGPWIKDVDNELAQEALDAWQFGFDFEEVMTESTPHIYLSALPFTPSSSFISKRFLPMYPRLLNFDVGQSLRSSTHTVNGFAKRQSSRSPVQLLAFSPQNNKHIATAFSDGTLWIWDYETGELVCEWESPAGKPTVISDIVFSPDGQLIYWCFEYATVKICNVWTKEYFDESYMEVPHNGPTTVGLYRCTITSDGRYIAFAVEHAFVLYDRDTRRELTQFPDRYSSQPVFSPNGDMFAFLASAVNREELCLWDTRRRTLKLRLKTSEKWPIFALNDKHVALGGSSRDGRDVEIWDIPTLTMIRTIQTNGSLIHSITDEYLVTANTRGYSIWNVSTGECIVETSFTDIPEANTYDRPVLAVAALAVAVGTLDGAVHVRPFDTTAESKTLDDVMTVDPSMFWLRGRYLIQRYFISSDYLDRLLRISDIRTVNNIVFEARNLSYDVAVSPSGIDGHVYVAYCTGYLEGICKLHLWSDVEGDFILGEGPRIVPEQFSPAGDRLISIEGNDTVKIWDTLTRALIGGPYIVGPWYSPYQQTTRAAFSARSDNFLIAYQPSEAQGIYSIEVRECQSGRISGGPFEISRGYDMSTIAYSANETRIICLSGSRIHILDAQTGELWREVFEDISLFGPSVQLSRNRKHVAWSLDKYNIMICGIDHGIQHRLRLSGPVRNFCFSDDSTRIMALYYGDDGYYFDISDISPGWTTCRVTRIYTAQGEDIPCPLSDGNYFTFIPDDYHVVTSLDLRVQKIMSLLYEHHQKNSQFGMLPIDDSETRREIQALIGSTSHNKEILEYALTAWNKALFSQAFQKENSKGWILGPHGELLFWVPKYKRGALWRPCATHIAAKNFTKLNFDKFVHGSRWTECQGTS